MSQSGPPTYVMPDLPVASRLRHRWRDRLCRAGKGWRTACDRLKWIGHKPSNLERHAEQELRLAGWFDKDGFYGDMMGHAVLRMIREFSEEGHSGMSAGLAINLFKTVSSFEPLTPLTGEDGEWMDVTYGDDPCWQNKRCSHVFKGADGAYDINGRVFREPSGACFTNRDSRVAVTFPYLPTTEYVDVPAPAEEA